MKKAHVTHPELKCTFCLDILGVKKNPNGQSYTQLGVVTKGTIIEVSAPTIELFLICMGGDDTVPSMLCTVCLHWRRQILAKSWPLLTAGECE